MRTVVFVPTVHWLPMVQWFCVGIDSAESLVPETIFLVATLEKPIHDPGKTTGKSHVNPVFSIVGSEDF